MSKNEHIVVVGGGHAAGQLIDSLRRFGHQGKITLVSEEPELPYQRPPLSKAYLAGEHEQDWLLYRPRKFYEMHSVDAVLGKRAVELRPQDKKLVLDDGSEVAYDKLALTTGTRVRKLPLPGTDAEGVYYLRTIADVDKIAAHLQSARRVAIIGGGFIGLEVAATLVERGVEVTVLEAQDRVLARVVAPAISDYFRAEHERHGVKVLTEVKIDAISGGNGQPVTIDCGDAGTVEADFLVIGIGILPNVELAEQAGLECDNGIVVDECARTSDPSIVAAGDCTSHPSAFLGRRVRLETVHNAVEQAKTAAAALLGIDQPYQQVPWVWSDQYDRRLQAVGASTDYDQLVTRGDAEAGKFAVFYFRDGQLQGMNSVNMPHEFAACRRILNERIPLTPEQAADVSVNLMELAPQRNDLVFESPWPPRSERRKGPLSKLRSAS